MSEAHGPGSSPTLPLLQPLPPKHPSSLRLWAFPCTVLFTLCLCAGGVTVGSHRSSLSPSGGPSVLGFGIGSVRKESWVETQEAQI